MINFTKLFGFKKPDKDEFYDVGLNNENLDSIDTALNTHTHDGRYYTEAEVDAQMSNKANGNPSTGDALNAEMAAGFITGAQAASSTQKSSYLLMKKQDGVPQDLRVQHQHVLATGRDILQFYLSGTVDGVIDKGFILDFNSGKAGASAYILCDSAAIIPDIDNKFDVGSASKRWRTYYGGTATIVTSDERQKTEIAPIADAVAFVMALKPVRYKLIDGTSGRYHNGMTSQGVKAAMDSVGLTDMDFAGYIASPILDDDGNPSGDYNYGLRYEEFVAPLIATVQEQQKQIEAQDKRISRLEQLVPVE